MATKKKAPAKSKTAKSKTSAASKKKVSSKQRASTTRKAASKSKSRKTSDEEVTIDRRSSTRRRDEDPTKEVDPKTTPSLERRQKVQRRRQIDPTTCERDYTDEEVEFMNSMDEYKRKSGRMFPTCSEVLEVLRDLGYVKLSPAEITSLRGDQSDSNEVAEAESTEDGIRLAPIPDLETSLFQSLDSIDY